MIKSFFLAITILANVLCISALYASEQDELTTPIFKALSKGDTAVAVNHIFPKGSEIRGWVGEDNIAQLKSNLHAKLVVLGKYYDYKLLSKSDIQGIYEHAVYIARYDRQPVLFKFDFYNAGKGWRIQNFTMDMDLDVVLEKALEVEIGVMAIPRVREKGNK